MLLGPQFLHLSRHSPSAAASRRSTTARPVLQVTSSPARPRTELQLRHQLPGPPRLRRALRAPRSP
eukprot:15266452-Alexandrium_andersonii.AAC.1